MSEAKDVFESIASHPKSASLAVAGMANFNAWFSNYEPVIKFATSILGIVLVSLLIVKHIIDIQKSLKKEDKGEG
jgi:hypothetical protein